MPEAKRSDGITLIEVMIATLLLAVALVGLAGAFPISRYAVHEGRQLTVGANLAQDAIEQMRRMGFGALGTNASGVQDITASVPMPTGFDSYTRQVLVENMEILGGIATLKRVTVTVSFAVAGDPVTATLITLLAR